LLHICPTAQSQTNRMSSELCEKLRWSVVDAFFSGP
jgi:hypothetical protein